MFFLSISSQNFKKIDSLKLLVNNYKTSDSTLITSYNDIGIEYAYTNYKLAKSYINKALSIAKKSKNKRGIAGSQNCLGIVYYYEKEYDSALVFFNKALLINITEKHKWGQASALHQIGVIEKYKGNYSDAIFAFQKSGDIFQSFNDSISLAKSIENIASSYRYMEYYQKAMLFNFKAHKIYEKKGNLKGLSRVYSSIGRIFLDKKEYSKALSYMNKALAGFEKIGYKRGVFGTSLYIGKCYIGMKEYEKALFYYKRTLDNRILIKSKKNIASAQICMSEVHYHLKNYNKSIDYGKKSLKNQIVLGDFNDKIKTYCIISKSYLAINKLKLAKKYIIKAIEIAKKLKNLKEEKDSYYILVSILEKEGKIIESFKYLKQINSLEVTLFEKDKDNKVRELEMIFETEKKQNQINDQRSEIKFLKQEQKINSLNRNIIIISTFSFIIVFGFGFYSNRQKFLKAKILIKHTELEKEKLDNELAYKKRELVTKTLNIAKKNVVFNKLKGSVENLLLLKENNIKYKHYQLLQLINFELKNDKESWDNFKKPFEEIHPNFYLNVKQKIPNITVSELRLMSLIKINLSYKEIGVILSVSNEGVKKARYRLRKKRI